MVEVRLSPVFAAWLRGLSDRQARAAITRRIARVESGLLGDVKSCGGDLSELRVHHGPGYRLYFVRRRGALIVLLCGGDKGSQARDIARAREMAADWE
jgi:putative addiction module killer protein